MAEGFPALYKSQMLQALETVDLEKVWRAIEMFAQARDEGRRIFVCGNGGSAANAGHFVCEMVKGANFKRPSRFRIMVLGEGMPTMTAFSNDLGYEHVLEEHLKTFAEPGDLLMAISGSGNSANVVNAVRYGVSIGCRTIGLTGRDGGAVGSLVDLNLHVAHPHMGRIEDSHMVMLHMICYYFMEEQAADARGDASEMALPTAR
jgi:D-sedoheptulose 7-phosphate isomerase